MTPEEIETEAMINAGCIQVSMDIMRALFSELGYRLDDECKGMHTNLTTGNSYMGTTIQPVQIDNGVRAFNISGRRDDNYRKMQQLRLDVFAVVRGRIVTV